MAWLASFTAELGITVSNGAFWLSLGQAMLFGSAFLLLGICVARLVGLLCSEAPAGETLGVGLATGLIVGAAWWAAIWSGGRSSFTPVAVGLAVAVALGVVRRTRSGATPHREVPATESPSEVGRPVMPWAALKTAGAGALFLVAIAMLYGATVAPGPRDGFQPLEYRDEAFYSVLARDLATTGTESNYLPSGFSELPGYPPQVWYHWGEVWLASAVILVFRTEPVPARYFVVLPLVLLAAASLTGTLARRMSRSGSRAPFLFGFVSCLLLAPVPFPGPHFGSWATGLPFEITQYGLAVVVVLVVLYCVTVIAERPPGWALAGFAGSTAAMIVPANVAIGGLAFVGAGSAYLLSVTDSARGGARRPTVVSARWARPFATASIASVLTVVWGIVTGHGLGEMGQGSDVSPFGASWVASLALVAIGSGMLAAIPLAWRSAGKASVQRHIYGGTVALLIVGAVAWGATLPNLTSYHLFFGGIAAFATPVAIAAFWGMLEHARKDGRRRLALGLIALCSTQLELGFVATVFRLNQLGPPAGATISVGMLESIRQLPPDAKVAYSCEPMEEESFVNPTLVGIDAHAGRRVVPMCFEADTLGRFVGAQPSDAKMNPGFDLAPQRALYPDVAARPDPGSIAPFLKSHGIHYIYADTAHPNTLVADAVQLATGGGAELLRVP